MHYHYNVYSYENSLYKLNSNKIVRITTENISLSDIKEDEDFCPISFFEQTEDGRKELERYLNS